MFDKIGALKSIIWAIFIIICLLALFIGLLSAAFSPYDAGEEKKPLVELGVSQKKGADGKKNDKSSDDGLPVPGKLNELPKSRKAGEEYIGSLTMLMDSASLPIESFGANAALVWMGEDGTMPVNLLSSARIIFPGDGSSVSISNAAMVSKPEILVLMIGKDGLADTNQQLFTEAYSGLLSSILSVSPETQIICCSIPSFAASYIPVSGLTTEMINNANLWLQDVCRNYAVWYADTASLLCKDGYLRNDFAAANGYELNGAAGDVIYEYLQEHALR